MKQKPNVWCVNRGNRLCKINLFINGIAIENVKTFKYLGFTLGAKNCSFNNTSRNLGVKTKRALFALNNRIKLSQMPIKLALKIFGQLTHLVKLYLKLRHYFLKPKAWLFLSSEYNTKGIQVCDN